MLATRVPSSGGEHWPRWTARVLGTLLFLVMGAFFIEHLEWFSQKKNSWPPLWVWLMQGVHLLMMASLLAAWRWELVGGFLVLATALVFFSQTAGRNFVLFSVVSALPALLWIYVGLKARQEGRGDGAGEQQP